MMSILRAKRSFDLSFNGSAGAVVDVSEYATGTITFSGLPVADETITVNGVVFTFKASADPDLNEVTIGADEIETADNVRVKLSASTNAALTVASYTDDDAGEVTITYDTIGPEGDAFTLAESATNTAVSGATLTGGDGFVPVERAIRLLADRAARVTIGNAADILIPANFPEVFYISGLSKISAISNDATAGKLNITVLTQ